MSPAGVGLGVDLHRTEAGRPLYLGGILFPDEPGLAGHSDGDVICHAVADALLGAAGLGDLGEHFPDTDPATKGVAGLDILRRVMTLLAGQGVAPGGCDITLLAERPRIAARRNDIRRSLAEVLELDLQSVSVKATRPEGLGLSGDGAGCIAVATVGPLAVS
jgi:2-C-methyl-D-erythritol 2,4-cyclodiphosphate synthase